MALITLSEVKDFLRISSTNQDNEININIIFVSAAIESYCGRTFASGSVTEIHDGGKSSIFVNKLPLNNVSYIAEYSGTEYVKLIASNLPQGERPNTVANTNAVVGVSWDKDTGEVTRFVGSTSGHAPLDVTYPSIFANYDRGVKITYNGGYDTTPSDIKLAAASWIKILLKGEQGASTISFSGHSKSSEDSSGGLPSHIKRLLDLYKIY
jgi:hypothetical protein